MAKPVVCISSARPSVWIDAPRTASGGPSVKYALIKLFTSFRHFPPARVWPPTERPIEKARALFASDFGVQLPPRDYQRTLLEVFFTYINPSLPMFDRDAFMKAWTFGVEESSVYLVLTIYRP
jgi:hypothetical protein